MKLQKAELAQKLNKIKGVVPKKTTMPVLQGILVMDGYLIANNTEMTVKAKIEGTEGESFIIPERAFDLTIIFRMERWRFPQRQRIRL